MRLEYQVLLALALDLLLGDPRWLPHPVRLIGWLADKTEIICRVSLLNEKVAGFFTVFIVLLVTGFSGWGLIRLADIVHPLMGDMVTVLMLYTCFATRDLLVHSGKIYKALQDSTLGEARSRVGMIVGRDTAQLDEEGVVRATVESVAENTVDGVTAPLFWAVIGGPVGVLLYKAVNTMDSIFGYKNERYLFFGWSAARLDDLANYLPSRITGCFTVLAAGLMGLRPVNAWRVFMRDRGRHSSPNAGQTEAAFAGALGVRLGGESIYFGKPVLKPVLGEHLEDIAAGHILQANRLVLVVTLLLTVFLLGVRLFFTTFLGVDV